MSDDWILKKIKNKGLKLTKPRLQVLEVLRGNKTSFIAVEEIFQIIDKSGEKSCDLTSIYRTLSAFEDIGLIEKSDFFGEASRYRLMAQEDHHDHHHHYFKCNSCGLIEVLCGDCNIHHYEKDLVKRGFSDIGHRLEFSGLCPSCNS